MEHETIAEVKRLMEATPAWKLSVAESLTCGSVQARFGGIAGASVFFLGGITAYAIEEKVKHLNVDRARAEAVESVSEDIARAMARGVCEMFGTDIGVATTGFAETPPPGRGKDPFAWWALAHRVKGRTEERTGLISCPGMTRSKVQSHVAETVVYELLHYLRAARRV